jgi:hypothetical protein
MKYLDNSHKLLKNKFLLYFILLLALADVIYLAMGKDYMSVAVFCLTGFVSSFFSKNMMVVLCIAMAVTNVLRFGSARSEGFAEGAKDKEDEQEETEENMENPDEEKEEKKDGGIVLTEEQIAGFQEKMSKMEAYEPLFKSMDGLLGSFKSLTTSEYDADEKKK